MPWNLFAHYPPKSKDWLLHSVEVWLKFSSHHAVGVTFLVIEQYTSCCSFTEAQSHAIDPIILPWLALKEQNNDYKLNCSHLFKENVKTPWLTTYHPMQLPVSTWRKIAATFFRCLCVKLNGFVILSQIKHRGAETWDCGRYHSWMHNIEAYLCCMEI